MQPAPMILFSSFLQITKGEVEEAVVAEPI